MIITHEPDVAAQARRVIHLADGLCRIAATSRRPWRQPARAATDARRGRMIGPKPPHGLTGIFANKLRSGPDDPRHDDRRRSVIVLIAVGNGSSRAVAASIEALGTNVLLVGPVSFGGTAVTIDTAPISLSIADAKRSRARPGARRAGRLAGGERSD